VLEKITPAPRGPREIADPGADWRLRSKKLARPPGSSGGWPCLEKRNERAHTDRRDGKGDYGLGQPHVRRRWRWGGRDARMGMDGSTKPGGRFLVERFKQHRVNMKQCLPRSKESPAEGWPNGGAARCRLCGSPQATSCAQRGRNRTKRRSYCLPTAAPAPIGKCCRHDPRAPAVLPR
jgi:hypothetical protein